ncbi:MAG: protein kinase [Lentisphaerae bacterium]|nr:protein kinase [Lentisphaerota bacterium]
MNKGDTYTIKVEPAGGDKLAKTVVKRTDDRIVLSQNAGMTLNELKRSYETILKAQAIYYPVAFQFLRELGAGRQGKVFLGLRQGARGCITEHAIKLYDPSLYRSPEEYWTDMGRIASQISQLQRVQSPNLVTRHSYEETYGIGYIQMEAIDGMDLTRLMTMDHLQIARAKSTDKEWQTFTETLFFLRRNRAALRPGLVVYILRSILRGLETLHAANFLHYDIKPGNIMIDRLGYVKIVDFGRAVLAGEKLTFLLGSPLYMAPETHRREIASIQADFYSVGLVGIEMLRGRSLTKSHDIDEETLLRMKMKLPERLHRILPGYVQKNDYLVSILGRFIDPEPGNRHHTAKDAEAGDKGLRIVDKQFAQAGVETEYSRILSDYLAKLVDTKTSRIEMPRVRSYSSDVTNVVRSI